MNDPTRHPRSSQIMWTIVIIASVIGWSVVIHTLLTL